MAFNQIHQLAFILIVFASGSWGAQFNFRPFFGQTRVMPYIRSIPTVCTRFLSCKHPGCCRRFQQFLRNKCCRFNRQCDCCKRAPLLVASRRQFKVPNLIRRRQSGPNIEINFASDNRRDQFEFDSDQIEVSEESSEITQDLSHCCHFY